MKKKYLSIIIVFAAFLFGFGLSGILLPDSELSESERRRLEQLPKASAAAVFSGEYSEKLESYLLDQFPLRDMFRGVNTLVGLYGFAKGDSDGIYIHGDSICKLDYPLDEAQLGYAAGRINYICDKYLSESDVYYSIIPDKNFFAAEPSGRPHMDYTALFALISEKLEDTASYIDITDCISLEDYYKTDIHWRQERIFGVAQRLAEGMAAPEPLSQEEYKATQLEGFRGALLGQSALPISGESLIYMESALTESARVSGLDFDSETGVYAPERIFGIDGYDVFLHGAQSLLVIETPREGGELIIFRDSFASSLAPLLLGAYSKITLVDIRYISSELLGDYVDFSGADVLFLYSTTVLNSGRILR